MVIFQVLQWKVKKIIQIKKVDAEKYADNLISYLDNGRSITSITLADLNNVLHRLTVTLLFKDDIENTNGFVVGEYIYCCIFVRRYNLWVVSWSNWGSLPK